MPIFYTDSASFDNLEITSSLVVSSSISINLGSNTSTFSGSFTGSFIGNGSSLGNIKIPVFKTTADSPAVTGTVNNTLATQSLIPANTFVADEIVEIKARIRKTGTAGTITQRWYINTTNNLSGATLIATHLSANTFLAAQPIRQMVIKTSTSTQVFNSSTNTITDEIASTAAQTTVANDWTTDQYILFAIQNANTADSTVYSFYKIMPL